MKVALVGSEFRSDAGDLALLDGEVDLVVYGHTGRLRGQSASATRPPALCRARALRPVVLTPAGPLVWFYPGLARALTEDRPDVVHVIAEPWRLIAWQAAAWARRRPETALVVSSADRNWFAVPWLERAMRRALARWTLARTDGFASESEAGVHEAAGFGLAPQVPTAVINTNPRDPTVFQPPTDPGERAVARRTLGLPVEGTGVGFVGRLSAEKGPELFLDAVARLTGADGFWAALAGTGPLEAAVRARARPSKVNYLGRLAFPSQVAELYRALDVVVVPSVRLGRWDEQGPRAVIEAMLSGCVLVTTNVGALPEMVGDVGIVVEPEAGALADGIVRSLGMDGHAGRRRALERYSGEAVARRMLQLWNEALDRRRSSRG